MAHSYTPGLKSTEKAVITKERRLPLKGVVQVSVGDKVKAGQVVAKTDLPGNVNPVNVANALSIMADEVPKCMMKKAGDLIEKGDIIAESKGFFGMFKSQCKSPIKGSVESVSSITGQVILREEPIPVEIKAYIDGEITEVYPDEGVEVRTKATFIQGIFGMGKEVHGIIKVLAKDKDQIIEESDITEDLKDMIVIGGSLITMAAFKKAMKIGLKGIITGGFNYNDIKSILGYEIGVAITGSEDIPTTLVVTEGFGKMGMAPGTFELLRKNDGKSASINGATQIRAGVIRPEVVISLEESVSVEDLKEEEASGVAIGDNIRVIRAPYFGRLGKVTELPPELRKMESETMVRVLEVEFDDGKKAILPRANIERIER